MPVQPYRVFSSAPPPGSELPPESVVATKPGRNLIQLRLSPDVSIPIRFKDVLPASWDVNETLTTLLPGEHDGLPGKLYPQDVLNHLALGGSTARLATDETATRGQSELFQSLTSQLEENGHIVSVCLIYHLSAVDINKYHLGNTRIELLDLFDSTIAKSFSSF